MAINQLNTRTSLFARPSTPQPELAPPAGHLPIAADAAEALAQQGLPGEVPGPQLPADPAATENCADIVYLSDLPLRPVEWLWQDRLASGTLAMISGESGSGKTWIALAIAAALSRGRAPFTGEKLKPCTVLYASTEHDSSAVIHPRFAKLNGDATRFVVLRGGVSSPSVLEDALERTQARLLILDPFHSLFVPASISINPGRPSPCSRRSLVSPRNIAVAFSSFAISTSVDPAAPPIAGLPRSQPRSVPSFSPALLPTHPRSPLCCR